jgi:hypothetical protein
MGVHEWWQKHREEVHRGRYENFRARLTNPASFVRPHELIEHAPDLAREVPVSYLEGGVRVKDPTQAAFWEVVRTQLNTLGPKTALKAVLRAMPVLNAHLESRDPDRVIHALQFLAPGGRDAFALTESRIAPLLSHAHPDVRHAARAAFAHAEPHLIFAHADQIAEPLKARSNHSGATPAEKSDALEVLARGGGVAVDNQLERVYPHLQSPDERVQLAAVRAMAQLYPRTTHAPVPASVELQAYAGAANTLNPALTEKQWRAMLDTAPEKTDELVRLTHHVARQAAAKRRAR